MLTRDSMEHSKGITWMELHYGLYFFRERDQFSEKHYLNILVLAATAEKMSKELQVMPLDCPQERRKFSKPSKKKGVRIADFVDPIAIS